MSCIFASVVPMALVEHDPRFLYSLTSTFISRTSGIIMDIYTTDEVTRHNNANDLWIVIHGAVYDVTAFHKEHPGGEEVLLQLAGQDATECFDSIGHSYEAINLRETLKIGELVDDISPAESKTTTTEVKEPMEDDWQYQEPKAEMQSQNMTFICGAIAIYAIIMFYWFIQ
ncbi:cytochrome b5-like isoform X1 [Temnothorax curvispinosus]|uniref:Cytochrome b5 n=1 Tax=Temnothorax curvispinosus TaxID=300111 RepID=A0A6J1Q7V4_9HYME|nr:cytochrome b5-like isoform X1 [Temnothorax curvispinosus]